MAGKFKVKKVKLEDLKRRFWEKVDIKEFNDCWNWISPSKKGDYGAISINGKAIRAHRVSWFLTNGEIINNLHVLHKCDNTLCVNPNHLFLGTHQDNMNDRDRKNRNVGLKGEKNGRVKLNEKIVLEIRKKYVYSKTSYKKLAKEYKVSLRLIACIIKRINWRHI